ncbi:hypothetical protein Cadr_000024157 [Camelus dromedarius]|uniref:Uncharacterized protein n=1 Tax=Camelus dromedarius TaxID=9838 RepID=A0A5N4CXL2_CAMDR|nr:hypothetical protein Cadr_000024157 [Camelus dromedarius]
MFSLKSKVVRPRHCTLEKPEGRETLVIVLHADLAFHTLGSYSTTCSDMTTEPKAPGQALPTYRCADCLRTRLQRHSLHETASV